MKVHTFRLNPEQDLKKLIQEYCSQNKILAGILLSSVGSLKIAHLRFSDHKQGTLLPGPFEITSITGTCSIHGMHLHITISDNQGKCLGGHLLEGNLIHTTAEVCLLELKDQIYKRENDANTGYLELVVEKTFDGPSR